MAKFRRKPLIIDAEQFFTGKPCIGVEYGLTGKACVLTAHDQIVYLSDGDWVTAEPNAALRFYPIKPDVIEKMYDRIEE